MKWRITIQQEVEADSAAEAYGIVLERIRRAEMVFATASRVPVPAPDREPVPSDGS